MTPIKRNLLYIFRGDLLRLRITWHGQSLTLSLGYHVDRGKWDGQRCRRNSTHGVDKTPASVINKAVEKFEETVDRAFYWFEGNDTVPTSVELKNIIQGKAQDAHIPPFGAAFDEFLQEGRRISQWSEATARKMTTIKHLLLKFDPKITMADFTADTLDRLMAYQTENAVVDAGKKTDTNTIVKYKGRYQNSTINRNMRFVKWFLRWADKKGYLRDSDFAKARTGFKTPKNPIVFLTWDELMKVFNLDLSAQPDLRLTRDMFCFCCFTSLRYSDLVNLHWSNVHGDALHVTTVKTTDTIIIDLNDYSREILDRYRSVRNERGTVFPTKSSQKMNQGLKKIAKDCGIDEPVRIVQMFGSDRKEITLPKYELVTTHCGRRTFICNALSLGIAPNIVMEWTGHSDYKAMKPYIAIADKIRRESMSVFNKKKLPE